MKFIMSTGYYLFTNIATDQYLGLSGLDSPTVLTTSDESLASATADLHGDRGDATYGIYFSGGLLTASGDSVGAEGSDITLSSSQWEFHELQDSEIDDSSSS